MSGVVRGLVCVGLVASSSWARAEGAAEKPVVKAATPTKSAKANKAGQGASAAPAPSARAPSAVTPSPSVPPSAPTQKEDGAVAPSKAAPGSAAPSDPNASSAPLAPLAPLAPPAVRVFMRSGNDPVVFWAREKNAASTPTVCTAPCDEHVLPGDYQLKLNGVRVEGAIKLAHPGTLQGKVESHEGSREGGWLALNVGGILTGVFVTVAALGGTKYAYAVGGGTLLAGGIIFAVTYRADRASVSFTPGEPIDMRGLPPPAPPGDNESAPPPSASLDRARGALGAQARGLGFQIIF
jgi:hypothetical protein